jgi:hypothetical protein
MALNTNIADPAANSYIDADDANAYVATREESYGSSSDYVAWNNLSEAAVELRLTWATMLVDSLRFRGVKATQTQSLAFPRIVEGDPLHRIAFIRSRRFYAWQDLLDACTNLSDVYTVSSQIPVIPPIIPPEVPLATVEVAYQVVHCSLLKLDALELDELETGTLSIGGLNMSLPRRDTGRIPAETFARVHLSAQTIIKLYLKKYVTNMRGGRI